MFKNLMCIECISIELVSLRYSSDVNRLCNGIFYFMPNSILPNAAKENEWMIPFWYRFNETTGSILRLFIYFFNFDIRLCVGCVLVAGVRLVFMFFKGSLDIRNLNQFSAIAEKMGKFSIECTLHKISIKIALYTSFRWELYVLAALMAVCTEW